MSSDLDHHTRFHPYFDLKTTFHEILMSSEIQSEYFWKDPFTMFVIGWKIENDFTKSISGVKNF